jgi:hypothetical protein
MRRFALDCTELLVVDELWTNAVAAKDPTAGRLAERTMELIDRVREGNAPVPDVLKAVRDELNDAWPTLRHVWLSDADSRRLDDYLSQQYGTFGDAACAVARSLDEQLEIELQGLREKRAELDNEGLALADLSLPARLGIGLLLIAVAAVGCGLLGGVVIVGGVAAGLGAASQGLAGIGVIVAGDALNHILRGAGQT